MRWARRVGAARAAGSPSGFCGANPRVWRPPLCIVPRTTYSRKTGPGESESGDAAGRLLGSKTKLVKRSEPRPGAAGPTLKRWGFLSFSVWAQEVPEGQAGKRRAPPSRGGHGRRQLEADRAQGWRRELRLEAGAVSPPESPLSNDEGGWRTPRDAESGRRNLAAGWSGKKRLRGPRLLASPAGGRWRPRRAPA